MDAPRPAQESSLTRSHDLVLETARATVLGVIGTLPVVGPTLSSVVSVYVPEIRWQRLTRLVGALDEAVRAVEDRLDGEFVSRREFAQLFEDVLDRSIRAKNDRKTAAFAAFAARSMTVDRADEIETERYLALLDDLTAVQLGALAAISTGVTGPLPTDTLYVVGARAYQVLASVIVPTGSDHYLDVAELTIRGLLQPMDDTSVLMHIASGNVRALLTPLGEGFVSYVTAQALAQSVASPGRTG